tara:strand:+ start:8986 stop:10035 length:1050 start_codon:yes stop_codon:yes gene_type:complete
MNKIITFVYFSNNSNSSGVKLKMNNFKDASKKLGYKSNEIVLNTENGFYRNIKTLFINAFNLKNIVFIRYNNSVNLLLFLFIFILKIRNVKIILDVPTPLINNLNEIIVSDSRFLKKTIIVFNTILLGPFPYFFSNIVVQYAEEHYYFKFLKKNNILIGNGIDVDFYQNFKRNLITKKIKFIIVANLAPWHGVDRVIKALSTVNYDFELNIVGGGVEYENLVNLTRKLKLQNKIVFTGPLERKTYINLMCDSDLGIGSMAWDLIKVKVSSALKLREYVSCGLPVVFTSFDPDLSNHKNFFEINHDQTSINAFFKNLDNSIKNADSQEIRKFAQEKLCMTNKLKIILDEF